VREVARPQQTVETDFVPILDAVAIGDEHVGEVALEIHARWRFVADLAAAVVEPARDECAVLSDEVDAGAVGRSTGQRCRVEGNAGTSAQTDALVESNCLEFPVDTGDLYVATGGQSSYDGGHKRPIRYFRSAIPTSVP